MHQDGRRTPCAHTAGATYHALMHTQVYLEEGSGKVVQDELDEPLEAFLAAIRDQGFAVKEVGGWLAGWLGGRVDCVPMWVPAQAQPWGEAGL